MPSILLGEEKSGDFISIGRFSGHFAFDDPDPDAFGTPILPIRSFDELVDKKAEVVAELEKRLKARNPVVHVLQDREVATNPALIPTYDRLVEYEFMAFAIEGSIRMVGGELRISFPGLAFIYGVTKALAVLGAAHSGIIAIGRLIDGLEYTKPYIEAAIVEVMDLDVLDFDWDPRPAEDVARLFLHRLREDRETLTDLEAAGIDLDAIAHELALEIGETWGEVKSEDREPPISH